MALLFELAEDLDEDFAVVLFPKIPVEFVVTFITGFLLTTILSVKLHPLYWSFPPYCTLTAQLPMVLLL